MRYSRGEERLASSKERGRGDYCVLKISTISTNLKFCEDPQKNIDKLFAALEDHLF